MPGTRIVSRGPWMARGGRAAVAAVASLAVMLPLAASTGQAAEAATAAALRQNPSNPLAGRPWGVYTGPADGVYPAYEKAQGADKALLATVALRPRVRWLGSWIPTDQIADKIQSYVTQAQAGDPETVVPMAIFRLWPHGEPSKKEPITLQQRRDYHAWIDQAAAGIGSAHVAMVLEPDLAVSLSGWRPRVRMRLAAYAASVFAGLPNTAVYLDAGDADWLSVDRAVALLRSAGIAKLRGFALGATHYGSLASEVAYGHQLVGALARAGLGTKHFVVDTADNGRPFTWLQYHAAHPQGDFDAAEACRTTTETRCVTLGVPPTWHVASRTWGLSLALRRTAAHDADGYLWFGRPWLYQQATPFLLDRTLQVARTTPYAALPY
ncbi:MAG: glycoside hydrolase family 6 protein [Marmoricola sp.]